MLPVFPLLIGRQGGLRTDVLNSLAIQQRSPEHDRIRSLESSLSNIREHIMELLFTLIGSETRNKQRNILLTLKRDVYNNKELLKYQELIIEFTILKGSLESYLRLSRELNEAQEKLKLLFNMQLSENISSVTDVANCPALANGILFSSGTLFDEWTKNPSVVQESNRNSRNLLMTILKYLTRSASKTSPFSSLNRIFVMEQIDHKFVSVDFSDHPSRMQLSNLVFHRVKQVLLGDKPFLRQLKIRTSTAISFSEHAEGDIHLFVNQNNHEVFRKLNQTSAITSVLELLGNSMKYGEFVSLLTTHFSQADDVAEKFLDDLIDLGIINVQFATGINDVNWITSLMDFIDLHDLRSSQPVQDLRCLLADLQQSVQGLEFASDVSARRQFIKHCSDSVTKFLNSDRAHRYLNELTDSGTLFYENAFTSSHENLDMQTFYSVRDRIREVYFALNTNSIKRQNRKKYCDYINNSGATKVSLLRAYEDVHLRNERINSAEGPGLDRLNDLIESVISKLHAEEIDTPIDISHFLKGPVTADDHRVRLGAFIQPLGPGFEQIVINSFSGGLGSNISRYLGFCPPSILDKCREHINHLGGDEVFADVRDASIHNASSFPVLSQNVIDIAGSVSESSDRSLPLNSLFLSIDMSGELFIADEAGGRINPFNFSMETLGRKSKLVQFLDMFNDTDLFGYTHFIQRINDFLTSSAKKNHIAPSPRIVFKTNTILKRRQWHISSEFLQSRLGEYRGQIHLSHLRIGDILAQYSIPQQVFVRAGTSPGTGKRQNSDNDKPQYIDFRSPLLTVLFMNLLTKCGDVLVFSEVLPDFNSTGNDSENYAKEYVMNL